MCPLQSPDMVQRRVEEEEEEEGVGGEGEEEDRWGHTPICDELWYAGLVTVAPTVVLHQEKGKDSDSISQAGGWCVL